MGKQMRWRCYICWINLDCCLRIHLSVKASSTHVIMIALTDLTEECAFFRLNFHFYFLSFMPFCMRTEVLSLLFFTFHHHHFMAFVCSAHTHSNNDKRQLYNYWFSFFRYNIYVFLFFNGCWWKHFIWVRLHQKTENSDAMKTSDTHFLTDYCCCCCSRRVSNKMNFMVWNVKKCLNFQCNLTHFKHTTTYSFFFYTSHETKSVNLDEVKENERIYTGYAL